MPDQPRLMTRAEAAAYCGYSPEHFSRHVAAGRLPQPLPHMHRWDRQAIDRALDALSGISAPLSPDDQYAAWEAELDEREAIRPKLNINKRLENALRHLIVRGASDGTDVRGASSKTFEELVDKGLAVKSSGGWQATAKARNEIQRIDDWAAIRNTPYR